ncbi:23393_t:CDS:2 [Racocetra persica]|uniref:23393_t:CDS:1 n=1 Tax=Racocetra persica TaxID=160502 RepID=A0ACA9LBT9_9GLOM|nr:23393_t:CDS:2 [Racocetra persica]
MNEFRFSKAILSIIPKFKYKNEINHILQSFGYLFYKINADYTKAIQNPYLQSLYNSPQGLLLTNFFAINSTSEIDYIASIYGSAPPSITTTSGHYNLTGCNIVDLLENKGITWKAYLENYNCGACYTGDFCPSGTDLYTRTHNPFISMTDINSNPARCAKLMDASQLDTDISNNQVPQFAYYVPNQLDDGHDTSLNYAMNWFKSWFEVRRNNPSLTTNTLFVIVWDYGQQQITFPSFFMVLQ